MTENTKKMEECSKEMEKWNEDHDDPYHDRLNDAISKIKRREYDPVYSALQELIAEMVIKTGKFHKGGDFQKRHDEIMRLLIGLPQEKIKAREIHDELDEFKIASSIFESDQKADTFGKAAAEVSRQRILSGYRLGDKIPKDISDLNSRRIVAFTMKLKRLAKRLGTKEAAEKFLKEGAREYEVMIETREDLMFANKLIYVWAKNNKI